MSELIEFTGDKSEGLSVAWFPSGCLRAKVRLQDGKPVEQAYWKDGEAKE